MTFLCTQELQRAYRFITSLEILMCKESIRDQIISWQSNMTREVQSTSIFISRSLYRTPTQDTMYARPLGSRIHYLKPQGQMHCTIQCFSGI